MISPGCFCLAFAIPQRIEPFSIVLASFPRCVFPSLQRKVTLTMSPVPTLGTSTPSGIVILTSILFMLLLLAANLTSFPTKSFSEPLLLICSATSNSSVTILPLYLEVLELNSAISIDPTSIFSTVFDTSSKGLLLACLAGTLDCAAGGGGVLGTEDRTAPRNTIQIMMPTQPITRKTALTINPTMPNVLPSCVLLRPSGLIVPSSIFLRSALPQIQARMAGTIAIIPITNIPALPAIPRIRISTPRSGSIELRLRVSTGASSSVWYAASSGSDSTAAGRGGSLAGGFPLTKVPLQSEQRTFLPMYSSGTLSFLPQLGHSTMAGII